MPPITAADVCAVIVTYHPDADFAGRVSKIACHARQIVVVDNGSEAESLERLCALADAKAVHLIANGENRGIATALNQGLEWAAAQGYRWALLFDQDSEPGADLLPQLAQVWAGFADGEQVALLGANFRHAGQELGGYPASDFTYGEGAGWYEVVMAITSGSLMSLDAHAEIGSFMDTLFIDHVDTEYCLRARSLGWHVRVTRAPLMTHAVGKLTPRRVFGKQVWTFNYSPLRWYYRTRNHVYILRRYLRQEPRWLGRTVNDLVRSWVKIALLEAQPVPKLASAARGVWHGLRLHPAASSNAASPNDTKRTTRL